MARPLSEDKRNAILAAATRVFATEGLGASTASIAKAAGVSNGSLFTYFATKADLVNALYLAIKSEMGNGALDGVPKGADLRGQLSHMWTRWLKWATSDPTKRRALAHLSVSPELTAETKQAGHVVMRPIAVLFEQIRARGPLRDAPPAFVMSLMNAMAEATMDIMIQEPKHAQKHSKLGFELMWRALT